MNVYERLMKIDWGKECPDPVETIAQMMKAMYLETFSRCDPACSDPQMSPLSAPRQDGRGVFCTNCKKWHAWH